MDFFNCIVTYVGNGSFTLNKQMLNSYNDLYSHLIEHRGSEQTKLYCKKCINIDKSIFIHFLLYILMAWCNTIVIFHVCKFVFRAPEVQIERFSGEKVNLTRRNSVLSQYCLRYYLGL